MTLFLLLNPKMYDPGDIVKRLHGDAWKKKHAALKTRSDELIQKIEKISETEKPLQKISQKITKETVSAEDMAALQAKLNRILEIRSQLTQIILEWEEEEAALVALLLEK